MLSELRFNRRRHRGFRCGTPRGYSYSTNDREIQNLFLPRLRPIGPAIGNKCCDLWAGPTAEDHLSISNVASQLASFRCQHRRGLACGSKDLVTRFSNGKVSDRYLLGYCVSTECAYD